MSRFVEYLYFLRFSILLWFILPLLALLDCFGVSTSLTRGIFALESPQQVFWATFFVVAANCVVLITARIVCVNGAARFAIDPPLIFVNGLGAGSRDRTWVTLIVVQIPGILSLFHVAYITVSEGAMVALLFATCAIFGIATPWHSGTVSRFFIIGITLDPSLSIA